MIVHARQKTLAAVREEIPVSTDTDLPLMVLVDALDEAVAGEAPGIAAFLASLANRGAAAIVVGMRPDFAVTPAGTDEYALLRELAPQRVYRLDDPRDETTRADISAMVRAQLLDSQDSPYRARGVPVDEIAALTASLMSPSFLFAQATARWLCRGDRAISDEPDWRERLIRSAGESRLGQLIEEDLAARVPDDLERVRDLLRAAAWTEGLGVPRYTIWPSLAEELSPTGASYSDRDVTWLLDKAGWYLTESSEDGQSVYRVFHQALADHFRTSTPGRPEDVQSRLAERLHLIATKAGGWERADPYVLHYLVAHAEQSAAGQSPSSPRALLADPQFVAHADADRVARAARRLRGGIRESRGAALASCMHLLGGLAPSQRLALLELTALQERLATRPGVTPARAAWWPTWARWRPSEAHVTLAGHDGEAWSVAFSPDGATLASGGEDCTVRLWDPITGELRQTLTGHTRALRSVAFSPDGAFLASAGHDRAVRLWDPVAGRHRRTLTGSGGSVRAVAFSPDGALLASGWQDGTVWLWDPATGEHARTLTGHGGLIRALAFSADGATIAAAGYHSTITLWDTSSGRRTQTLDGHGDSVLALAFSPCGATLASGSDDATIRLWDATTGEPQPSLTGHTGPVRDVAFSPDATVLASAGDDGTVRLWDPVDGTRLRTLTGHDGYVRAVAFASDGRMIASGGHDRTVRLWESAGRELQPIVMDDGASLTVAFSPNAATLASGGYDGTVRLWDAVGGEPRLTLRGHQGPVRSVAFSPGGAPLASGGDDGTVRLWDLITGEHRLTLTGHEDWVRSIAFSSDGTMLASSGDDGTVRLWDPITGEHRLTLTGHEDWVRSIAFSPDATTLASAGHDCTIRLWDPITGEHRLTLTGHEDWVRSIAFSPDATTLASAGRDRKVMLWDASAGDHRLTFDAGASPVRSLGFSFDGAVLAIASRDGVVRLRDTATNKPFGQVPVRSNCNSVAWSRRSRLAIATDAGVAVIEVR